MDGQSNPGDAILRVANCLSKLQEQMERLAHMQSDTTSTIGRLSGAVMNLTQEMNSARNLIQNIEESVKVLQSSPQIFTSSPPSIISDQQNGLSMNSVLPPSIDPSSLFCDPRDLLGPLVFKRTRVLVVEDDVSYQWLVSKHLEARGIECVIAPTARDAYAVLKNGSFDLILMDIQLPGGVSGLEAVQHIRLVDSTTPIVSMTSATAPKQIASYLAGGMNDILPKPFSRDGLLTLVNRFCGLTLADMENQKERVSSEENNIFFAPSSLCSGSEIDSLMCGGGGSVGGGGPMGPEIGGMQFLFGKLL